MQNLSIDRSDVCDGSASENASATAWGEENFDGHLWRRLPLGWRKGSDFDSSVGDEIIPASSMSVASLQAVIHSVERDIVAAELELQRRVEEEQEKKRLVAEMAKLAEEQAKMKFMEQEEFYYGMPQDGATACASGYVLPARGVNRSTGARERPPLLAAPVVVPPLPPPDAHHIEQETAYAERQTALSMSHRAIQSQREAASFDADEAMFLAQQDSSDDSDGYDEDFEAEWRSETNEIFSACRAVESNVNDEEAFSVLGHLIERKLVHITPLTPTEQEMLWNTVRHVYRKAEPIHSKHWLTSCGSIMEANGFANRPSVANWCYLLSRVLLLAPSFSERRQAKLMRWKGRSVFLVRKRMIVLREFGVEEPTWQQLHVSVSGYNRDAKVPLLPLADTLDALTALSTQQEVVQSSVVV